MPSWVWQAETRLGNAARSKPPQLIPAKRSRGRESAKTEVVQRFLVSGWGHPTNAMHVTLAHTRTSPPNSGPKLRCNLLVPFSQIVSAVNSDHNTATT
jgi:hypothetical protein